MAANHERTGALKVAWRIATEAADDTKAMEQRSNKRRILSRLLPLAVKRQVGNYIGRIAEQFAQRLYFASHAGENSYCVKSEAVGVPDQKQITLPVPPKNLWVGYADDVATYLSEGRRDVADLVRILSQTGFSVAGGKRILEFGCAAGRMIRHFPEIAPDAQLWGVDVSADHIRWCVQNLTPTARFATTTLIPHLPFADGYFDLVFCGSVFTHIEDIQESWLLELGRVLRASGRLYLTIHDENTVRLLDTKYRDHWLARTVEEQPVYVANKNNFEMIVFGRGVASQVFYHSNYFRFICPPIFRWCSLTPEAYGYQSAVVLEKVPLGRHSAELADSA